MTSLDSLDQEEKYLVFYNTNKYILNPLLYNSDLFKVLIQTGDKEFHLKEYEKTFNALNDNNLIIDPKSSVDEINTLTTSLDYFGYEPAIEHLNKVIFEIECKTEYKNLYDFIYKNKDEILFSSFRNKNLPLEFCEHFKCQLSSEYLSYNKNITEEFILRTSSLNIYSICVNYKFTYEFLKEYNKYLLWDHLALNANIPLIVFEANVSSTDERFWTNLSSNPNLTETFIETYKDKINFSSLSKNKNLTETIAKKYISKLDFAKLSKNTNLSNEFFDMNSHRITWDAFSRYNLITCWFYEKHHNSINKYELSKNENLTQEFVKKYLHDINYNILLAHNNKLPFDFIFNTLPIFEDIRIAYKNKTQIFLPHSNMLTYLLKYAPNDIILDLRFDFSPANCNYLSDNKNLSERYIHNLIRVYPNVFEHISEFKSITVNILRQYCNVISPIKLNNYSIGPALQKITKYKSNRWKKYIDDLFE